MGADNKRLALYLSSAGGGVERMLINLAGGLAGRGAAVDLLVDTGNRGVLTDLPTTVRVIEVSDGRPARAVASLEAYLRAEQPWAIMVSKIGAARAALTARRRAASPVRVVLRAATTYSAVLAREPLVRRWFTRRALVRLTHEVDAIVAVSHGVAQDLARLAPGSAAKMVVIANPVITPALRAGALVPVAHPWFVAPDQPIIVSVGRFSRAKDFPTLVNAFAQVRAQRRCCLVIVGDGRQRAAIEKLIARLGLEQSVWLPGFAANPYSYLARARLFVLSSRWEGSPNALTEALALGRPVIATDCTSGPREVLQDGRYGRLVPVGDVAALAQAMVQALDEPAPDPEYLKSAVAEYTVERAATRYLEVLGFDGTSRSEQPAQHPRPFP